MISCCKCLVPTIKIHFGNKFGSIFRSSSVKPFIFKHFSHFYYHFIKIQNPQKALFSRLFSISTLLNIVRYFLQKGAREQYYIYFDAPIHHPRHEYNRYTLSENYCCHLKCKIPRHIKRSPTKLIRLLKTFLFVFTSLLLMLPSLVS